MGECSGRQFNSGVKRPFRGVFDFESSSSVFFRSPQRVVNVNDIGGNSLHCGGSLRGGSSEFEIWVAKNHSVFLLNNGECASLDSFDICAKSPHAGVR